MAQDEFLLPFACALMLFVANPLQPLTQSDTAQAGLWLHAWNAAQPPSFAIYFTPE